MTLNLRETYEAKYKNVPFLVFSAGISGGRKDVLHSYPNSEKQTVEDLGKLPRSFTFDAAITGPNYFGKRDDLINALESNGSGVLIHPFYGAIENVVARPFNITEDFSRLGVATFSLTFDITDNQGIPTKESTTVSEVDSKNVSFVDSITNSIAENFSVTDNLIGSFDSAKNKLSGFINVFEESVKFLNNGTDFVNSLTSQIAEFNANIIELTRAPRDLAEAIQNLFSTAEASAQTSEAMINSMNAMFDFGDDDPDPIINNSQTAVEKQTNNEVVNISVQTQALSYSMNAVTDIEFSSVEEIDEISQSINQQYEKVTNKTYPENIEPISNDSIDALKTLKGIFEEFITEVRINTKRVVEVKTPTLPMRVISYNYYADSTQSEILDNLNKNPDFSFIENNVRVLAE